MEAFKSYSQSCKELKNQPLVLQKIYHNTVVCEEEESKLLFYDSRHQSVGYTQTASTRNISKTLPRNKIDDEVLR